MKSAIIMGAGALALCSSGAPAASATTGTSRVVAFADLDVSTRAGQQELQRRVDRAIDALCAEAHDGGWTFRETISCKSDTRALARPLLKLAVDGNSGRIEARAEPPSSSAANK